MYNNVEEQEEEEMEEEDNDSDMEGIETDELQNKKSKYSVVAVCSPRPMEFSDLYRINCCV